MEKLISIDSFLFYMIVAIAMLVAIILIIFAESGKNTILSIIATCVAVSLIISLLFLASLNNIIEASNDNEEILVSSNKIISLNNDDRMNGTQYFKIDYINHTLHYNFMIDLGDDTFLTNSVPIDKAKIIYTNDTPRIEAYNIKYKMFIFYKEVRGDWIIRVPKDAIINDF